MKRITLLPTLMTVGNIICGFTAIVCIVIGFSISDPFNQVNHFSHAAGLIFLGMIFDALDGKFARLTKVTSDFGAELDSLADIITFGVAPALLVRMMSAPWHLPQKIGTFISMLFVVCAALRLARFNVETESDEESHHYFKGLPTPAAAGFIASLVILHRELVSDPRYDIEIVAQLLPFVTFILAGLMVSKVRYIHVINKLLKDQSAFDYLVELIFLGALIALTKAYSLVILFGVYVVSGTVGSVRHWLVEALEEEEEESVV